MDENIKIDKKSKVFLSILVILILVSVGLTFYRTMIAKDFEVFYDDYEEELMRFEESQ